MRLLIKALLLIFFIQCAMTAALYLPDTSLMQALNTEQLIPFEPYLVDEIHIGDEQGNEAVLIKGGDHWILPDLAGLSISPELIEKLEQSVLNANTSWPVATSVAARQRFQLTDYNFQRRLTLIGNGETGPLERSHGRIGLFIQAGVINRGQNKGLIGSVCQG